MMLVRKVAAFVFFFMLSGGGSVISLFEREFFKPFSFLEEKRDLLSSDSPKVKYLPSTENRGIIQWSLTREKKISYDISNEHHICDIYIGTYSVLDVLGKNVRRFWWPSEIG